MSSTRKITARLAIGVAAACTMYGAQGQTSLSDQPIITSRAKVANIALTPSVEFPTAINNAHPDIYFDPTKTYVGYFDPYKCYKYNTTPASAARYFSPTADVSDKTLHQCSGGWSGNLLNYATMQTIDIFRWSMTGGSRWVDSTVNYDRPYDSNDSAASLVVLRRAYHNTQGSDNNFYVKILRKSVSGGISKYVDTSSLSGLSTSQTLGFNSRKQGSTFRVANLNDSNPDKEPANFPNTYVTFNAATEVCKFNAALVNDGLEANCTKYLALSGQVAYKPEGLMQQYKKDFRFSVFAYYNRPYQNGSSGAIQDGAPMRAPMKYVDIELTDMGAYIKNPDVALAASSGVANSGAMNYINKFGFESQVYKHYDNVSELYAEAIRYFGGATAPSGSTQVAAPSLVELDYFPAVNSWTTWPAIKNWCDQNFIVGIGDVNTHADRHISPGPVPTSTLEPTKLAAIDAGMDAVTWTNQVGSLEGMTTKLAERMNINGDGTGYDFTQSKSIGPGGCCSDNGFYMAGLAYYANTNDINSGLKNVQTVQTYWVDILEYGIYKHRNQYWLAAKYGGFLDSTAKPQAPGLPATNKVNDAPNTNSEWWVNCRTLLSTGTCAAPGSFMLPDNYFVASDAAQMVASLSATFSQIKSSVSASAGSTGATNVFQNYGTTDLVKTEYNSSDWSGDVIKYGVSGFDSTSGVATTTVLWNAKTVLNTQFAGTGWDQSRRIVTMGYKATVSGKEQYAPKPFRVANLSPLQLATFGATAAAQQDVLNYLRGSKAKEGNPYRKRTNLLGDIVKSLAVIVGPPNAAYSDVFNPGYGAFKQSKAKRPEVIYVGANDGMMHALRSSDGKELFAYVPGAVYEGPFSENVGVDETDGIAALANAKYSHRYYVNATPVVRDVDFARAGDLKWREAATSDWRTILVGGLGKGGKSFYAIDVTDPPELTDSETAVAGKVLWEFTDNDLGYSFGEPLIIKTERWGWVVVVTSGYNNASGVGTVFFLNPKDGTVLASAPTASGSSTQPAGLTEVTGYTASYQDWIYREVYAGDLDGKIWRFDLPVNIAATSGSSTISVFKVATLKDSLNNPQPVTVPPWVDVSKNGRRYVFVGTGRALDSADVTGTTGVNVQRQTLYAIPDGDAATPYLSATRPIPNPYERSNLTKKDLSDITNVGASCTSTSGWYFDLPDGGGAGKLGTERIIRNMKADGSLTVISDVPSNDPCDSSGWYSWLYLLDMDCAKTVLNMNGTVYARYGGSGTQVLSASTIVSNGVGLLIETDSGLTKFKMGTSGDKPKVVNWRVIGQ